MSNEFNKIPNDINDIEETKKYDENGKVNFNEENIIEEVKPIGREDNEEIQSSRPKVTYSKNQSYDNQVKKQPLNLAKIMTTVAVVGTVAVIGPVFVEAQTPENAQFIDDPIIYPQEYYLTARINIIKYSDDLKLKISAGDLIDYYSFEDYKWYQEELEHHQEEYNQGMEEENRGYMVYYTLPEEMLSYEELKLEIIGKPVLGSEVRDSKTVKIPKEEQTPESNAHFIQEVYYNSENNSINGEIELRNYNNDLYIKLSSRNSNSLLISLNQFLADCNQEFCHFELSIPDNFIDEEELSLEIINNNGIIFDSRIVVIEKTIQERPEEAYFVGDVYYDSSENTISCDVEIIKYSENLYIRISNSFEQLNYQFEGCEQDGQSNICNFSISLDEKFMNDNELLVEIIGSYFEGTDVLDSRYVSIIHDPIIEYYIDFEASFNNETNIINALVNTNYEYNILKAIISANNQTIDEIYIQNDSFTYHVTEEKVDYSTLNIEIINVETNEILANQIVDISNKYTTPDTANLSVEFNNQTNEITGQVVETNVEYYNLGYEVYTGNELLESSELSSDLTIYYIVTSEKVEYTTIEIRIINYSTSEILDSQIVDISNKYTTPDTANLSVEFNNQTNEITGQVVETNVEYYNLGYEIYADNELLESSELSSDLTIYYIVTSEKVEYTTIEIRIINYSTSDILSSQIVDISNKYTTPDTANLSVEFNNQTNEITGQVVESNIDILNLKVQITATDELLYESYLQTESFTYQVTDEKVDYFEITVSLINISNSEILDTQIVDISNKYTTPDTANLSVEFNNQTNEITGQVVETNVEYYNLGYEVYTGNELLESSELSSDLTIYYIVTSEKVEYTTIEIRIINFLTSEILDTQIVDISNKYTIIDNLDLSDIYFDPYSNTIQATILNIVYSDELRICLYVGDSFNQEISFNADSTSIIINLDDEILEYDEVELRVYGSIYQGETLRNIYPVSLDGKIVQQDDASFGDVYYDSTANSINGTINIITYSEQLYIQVSSIDGIILASTDIYEGQETFSIMLDSATTASIDIVTVQIIGSMYLDSTIRDSVDITITHQVYGDGTIDSAIYNPETYTINVIVNITIYSESLVLYLKNAETIYQEIAVISEQNEYIFELNEDLLSFTDVTIELHGEPNPDQTYRYGVNVDISERENSIYFSSEPVFNENAYLAQIEYYYYQYDQSIFLRAKSGNDIIDQSSLASDTNNGTYIVNVAANHILNGSIVFEIVKITEEETILDTKVLDLTSYQKQYQIDDFNYDMRDQVFSFNVLGASSNDICFKIGESEEIYTLTESMAFAGAIGEYSLSELELEYSTMTVYLVSLMDPSYIYDSYTFDVIKGDAYISSSEIDQTEGSLNTLIVINTFNSNMILKIEEIDENDVSSTYEYYVSRYYQETTGECTISHFIQMQSARTINITLGILNNNEYYDLDSTSITL